MCAPAKNPVGSDAPTGHTGGIEIIKEAERADKGIRAEPSQRAGGQVPGLTKIAKVQPAAVQGALIGSRHGAAGSKPRRKIERLRKLITIQPRKTTVNLVLR